MKRSLRGIFGIGLIIIITDISAFGTSLDPNCFTDCLQQNYSSSFCRSRCSSADDLQTQIQKKRKIDQMCVLDCVDKGYMLSTCQNQCSYDG